MLEYAAVVDRGLVHETNDDAALLEKNIINEGEFFGKSDSNEGIFAVADGVGAFSKSSFASRKILGIISECSARNMDNLISLIRDGNDELVEYSQRALNCEFATTLCVLCLIGKNIFSVNLGNSRLYRYRKEELKLLTRDDSKVQQLIDFGYFTKEEAKSYPDRNIITRFVGNREFNPDWVEIKEHEETAEIGDLLILCTDGISDYVDEEDINAVLNEDISLINKAKKIVAKANELGGYDNATIAIIKVCE